MNKKYELTNETIEHDGVTLHRIKALTYFSYVKPGYLGGFVQSEDNLSHNGEAWVGGEAKVYGTARVDNNAQVVNNAIVCQHAKVTGNACVCKNAIIKDSAVISGSA